MERNTSSCVNGLIELRKHPVKPPCDVMTEIDRVLREHGYFLMNATNPNRAFAFQVYTPQRQRTNRFVSYLRLENWSMCWAFEHTPGTEIASTVSAVLEAKRHIGSFSTDFATSKN